MSFVSSGTDGTDGADGTDALFARQKCTYRAMVLHKAVEGEFQIPVNLSSDTVAPFPCELHELSFVLPNATFLSSGTSFDQRSRIPTLSGGRSDVVTAVRVENDDGERRIVSMPMHTFSMDTNGVLELTTRSPWSSSPSSLFSHVPSKAFMEAFAKRVSWIQTERTQTRRQLKMVVKTMHRSTGDEEAQVSREHELRGEDDFVPTAVMLEGLSFARAKAYARSVHASLHPSERAIYAVPTPDKDLFLFGDGDGGWSNAAIRSVVEARIARWQSSSLDRAEQPHMRRSEKNAKAMRAVRQREAKRANRRGVGVASGADADEIFKPKDVEKNRQIQERTKQAALKASQRVLPNPPRYVENALFTFHTFFHPATSSRNPRPEEMLERDLMLLLKTTISIRKKRDGGDGGDGGGDGDDADTLSDALRVEAVTSPYGQLRFDSLLPAPAPMRRSQIMVAVDRAILRAFYDIDADAMSTWFPEFDDR